MRPKTFAKTLFVAALLALAAALPAGAFETRPFDDAGFKAAQDAGKPVLVDIFAPWCGTCKAQQKVLAKLEGDPDYASLVVFKVDYDNQRDVVKRFEATTQSTLIAFKGQTETARSIGDTREATIRALISTTLQ